MAKGDNIVKEVQSNFNLGEVSDLVGARPDLQKYYNGLTIGENIFLYPEGGMFRRPGTRLFREVKNSDLYTMLAPFEYNVEQSYVLEMGYLYTRIYDGTDLVSEVETPFVSSDLRDIHHRQSADVMFFTHPRLEMQRLNRITPTSWSQTTFAANPPPSFEPDTDISQGIATLTPGATTGASVTFTASEPYFFLSDVSRSIKHGASRAVISAIGGGGTTVTARIVSAFPDTNPIPAGEWFLDGSPNAGLDPANKGPIGKDTSLVASQQAFRADDVGKFIRVYDGIVQIFSVSPDTVTVTGLIVRELSAWESTTDPDDPDEAPAGSWTLESPSWSDAYGWPRTLEFHQGRLVVAGTTEQPTTFWPSAVDAFDDFGRGVEADQAMEYTIAARKVNQIEWLTSLGSLFIGDAGNEHSAKGQGVDAPFGGDQIPYVRDQSSIGSMHVQPIVVGASILFANRFKNKIFELSYSLEQDTFAPQNKTLLARQIGAGHFAQHAPAYAQEPNSILFWPLDNGQMACLTFNKFEEVNGWSRFVTDGVVESVATRPTPTEHEVYLIVRRVINGVTKRYIEIIDADYQTDSAVRGNLTADQAAITGLNHLEGKSVDVLIGGSYIGQKTVEAGRVNISDQVISQATTFEVGLHYTSTARTMRAVVPGQQGDQMRGHRRKAHTVALELKNTIGGTINGHALTPQRSGRPFSGTVIHNIEGDFDYDGYITLVQDQPYGMTILGLAAKIEFASDIG